ncbi:MAG: riboflavin synthase [Candidatus Kapaibacterium sp.]|nr:MAG: riboflavin synthase [Candidatus Kapabacteria bacterium]
MFTGLIEEIGTVRSMQRQGGGYRISVAAKAILNDVKIDDSISINGACQTVVRWDAHSFDVEAVEETVQKTTLGSFSVGKRVNLERAMQLGGRLGGHIVQGHVDTRGKVVRIEEQQTSWLLSVDVPEKFARYIVPVGSICIDGVSLTAARVEGTRLTVAIIPHTWAHTTLHELSVGGAVNLEFDIIGKYVERMMNYGVQTASNPDSAPAQHGMSEEWLRSMGY